MYVLASILGILAIFLWIFSITRKEKAQILLCQIVSNFIYGLQYIFLKAFGAGILNLSSFVRLSFYYHFENKEKPIPKELFMIFIIIILAIGIVTYHNILDLIPTIITLVYAYSFWQKNLSISRICYILCAFVWVYYNFQVTAYVSIIGNILEIVFGLYSFYKYQN